MEFLRNLKYLAAKKFQMYFKKSMLKTIFKKPKLYKLN